MGSLSPRNARGCGEDTKTTTTTTATTTDAREHARAKEDARERHSTEMRSATSFGIALSGAIALTLLASVSEAKVDFTKPHEMKMTDVIRCGEGDKVVASLVVHLSSGACKVVK